MGSITQKQHINSVLLECANLKNKAISKSHFLVKITPNVLKANYEEAATEKFSGQQFNFFFGKSFKKTFLN